MAAQHCGVSMSRDVVYFVNAEGSTGAELRYSLRSLENLPHNRVIMLGWKPPWARNVELRHHRNHSQGKWWTLMHKFLAVAEMDDLTDVVYCMGDDFYVTKQMDELPPMWCNTLAKRTEILFEQRGDKTIYGDVHRATNRVLLELGVEEPKSFQLHVPQVTHRASLPVGLMKSTKSPLGGASLAGNLGPLEPRQIFKDNKVTSVAALKEWRKENNGFLSSSDKTFKESGVERLLAKRFPERSRYEAAR